MIPFLDLFLHIDEHLTLLVREYGTLSYLILFLIIFAETGLVITPFLPGDSLLFAAGALAAQGSFDLATLMILLMIAAIGGDALNFYIGKKLGKRMIANPKLTMIKPEHLEKTHHYFEKYGGKTIIIARFLPIVRTLAPFVAGVGEMNYRQFVQYNIIGGIIWISLFLLLGYLFGEIPIVKENFEIAVLAIIVLSIVPPVIEFINHKKNSKSK